MDRRTRSVEQIADGGATAEPEHDVDADPASSPDSMLTLVEVAPGIAAVLGDVPDSFEMVGMDLLPEADRTALSAAVASVGAVAELTAALRVPKGLYRLDSTTTALLRNGAELAVKDGANIGTVMQNGKVVRQARLIPVTGPGVAGIATGVAAAAAVIAMQVQLDEITRIAQANLALTSQVLDEMRHDQWAELTGLTRSLDRTLRQAGEAGALSRSQWENVAGIEPAIEKQLDLYRRKVRAEIASVRDLDGTPRREYLENNAESIVFDVHALLHSLRLHVGYQGLRAARARQEEIQDGTANDLPAIIVKDATAEFEASRAMAAELVDALSRELHLLAETEGRRTIPLTRAHRDTRKSREMGARLLAAIDPVADRLRPAPAAAVAPPVVSAPEELDLAPYLNLLRWHLEPGEELAALVFAFQPGAMTRVPVPGAVIGKRADASWTGLGDGRMSGIADAAASSTLVAVTDRRVLTATPRELLRNGAVTESIPLAEVQLVRTPEMQPATARRAVTLLRAAGDLQWMFPAAARGEDIEAFARAIGGGHGRPTETIEAG